MRRVGIMTKRAGVFFAFYSTKSSTGSSCFLVLIHGKFAFALLDFLRFDLSEIRPSQEKARPFCGRAFGFIYCFYSSDLSSDSSVASVTVIFFLRK